MITSLLRSNGSSSICLDFSTLILALLWRIVRLSGSRNQIGDLSAGPAEGTAKKDTRRKWSWFGLWVWATMTNPGGNPDKTVIGDNLARTDNSMMTWRRWFWGRGHGAINCGCWCCDVCFCSNQPTTTNHGAPCLLSRNPVELERRQCALFKMNLSSFWTGLLFCSIEFNIICVAYWQVPCQHLQRIILTILSKFFNKSPHLIPLQGLICTPHIP